MERMQPLHMKSLLLHFQCCKAFLELKMSPEVCWLRLGSEPGMLGRFSLGRRCLKVIKA